MNLTLTNVTMRDGVNITVLTVRMQESNAVSMQNLDPVIQTPVLKVHISVKNT